MEEMGTFLMYQLSHIHLWEGQNINTWYDRHLYAPTESFPPMAPSPPPTPTPPPLSQQLPPPPQQPVIDYFPPKAPPVAAPPKEMNPEWCKIM
ncbi:hypothetical protein CRYUN_Cryun25bG0006200 [Craigia yunnanensis]